MLKNKQHELNWTTSVLVKILIAVWVTNSMLRTTVNKTLMKYHRAFRNILFQMTSESLGNRDKPQTSVYFKSILPKHLIVHFRHFDIIKLFWPVEND